MTYHYSLMPLLAMTNPTFDTERMKMNRFSCISRLNFSSTILRRTPSRNYYEVLNLKKDCTAKEIKAAFVKLSKEFHPDRSPNDPYSHLKFVKLNEAYSILSKPESRRIYDMQIAHPYFSTKGHNNNRPPGWVDETFWESRDRSRDKQYEGKPYYGIKGLKRVPNAWIAIGCTLFMVVGTALQFYSIKLGRKIATDKSKIIQDRHNESYMQKRKRAHEFDIDAQLEILRKNIEKNNTRTLK